MDRMLPEGWAIRRLGEVLTVSYGKALPKKLRRSGGTYVYGSNGPIGRHNESLTGTPVIVIGRKGSAGIINFSEEPVWPIDTTYFIDRFGPFDPRFLRHVLMWLGLSELDRSTAIPGLSREQLYERHVAIPPRAEQRRIANCLDEIEDRCELIGSRLRRSRVALERHSGAVLASGCRGQLTSAWREARTGPATSSRLRELGKGLSSKASTGLGPPDPLAYEYLPENWEIAHIGEVSEVMLGGTPRRENPDYWHGDIPWVASGEVANRRIVATGESITKVGLDQSNAKLYQPGTVLIAMIGEGKTRGQSAILDVAAATNQNVAAIDVDRELLDPEFVWRWARAQYTSTRAAGRGGNQAALNRQKVRELVIPVPTLEEQAEIVKRIDSMLIRTDQLLKQIAEAQEALDQILPSSRAKAFRGDLVPTEAALARAEGRNFESADELLLGAKSTGKIGAC